ncbi:hypothetical protein [Flavobacterium sp.]|uniref:hypothetical protein n=1 Tax=Flavobacterium sp. TaxID=239 RepID=UPI003751452A
MKSQIQENQKNSLLSFSKKVLMLVVLILGTTAMVTAATLPVKKVVAKEAGISKHKKAKADRKAKKMEAKKAESAKK